MSDGKKRQIENKHGGGKEEGRGKVAAHQFSSFKGQFDLKVAADTDTTNQPENLELNNTSKAHSFYFY